LPHHKRKTDLSALHPFGCEVFARLEKQQQKKFEAKAMGCALLSYDAKRKAYRLLRLQGKGERVIYKASWDCIFVHDTFPKWKVNTDPLGKERNSFELVFPDEEDEEIPTVSPQTPSPPTNTTPQPQPSPLPGTPPLNIRSPPPPDPAKQDHRGWSFMKDVSQYLRTGTCSGRGFHVNTVDVREAIGNTHKAHALRDEGARQHFEEQQK
jgi:hypothetical protein